MTEQYWNQKIETMTRAGLEERQLKLFREKVRYCYENSPVYRKKLAAAGVKPEDIKTLKDVQKVPFTVKTTSRTTTP